MNKYENYILNASNECPKWKPFSGKSKKCSRCYEGVKPKRPYPLRLSKKCKKKGSKKNIIPSVSGDCSSCFDFGIRQFQDSHKTMDRFNKKYFSTKRKTTTSGISWDVVILKKGTMLWHGWKIYDDDSANHLYLENEDLWLTEYSKAQMYAKELNANMSLFIVKDDIELFDCDSLYNYWQSFNVMIRSLEDYYKDNMEFYENKKEIIRSKPEMKITASRKWKPLSKEKRLKKIDHNITLLTKEIELFREHSDNFHMLNLPKLYKELQSKKIKKATNRRRGKLEVKSWNLLLNMYFQKVLFGDLYPETYFDAELTNEDKEQLPQDPHSSVIHWPNISYQDFEDLNFKYRKSKTTDRFSEFQDDDVFIDILNILGFSGMSYFKVDKNNNKRPNNSHNHHHQEICVLQKDINKLELVLSYPIQTGDLKETDEEYVFDPEIATEKQKKKYLNSLKPKQKREIKKEWIEKYGIIIN